MKLDPGECTYDIPDCGQLISVLLDEGERERKGYVYPMTHISPAEWIKMRGDETKPAMPGRPLYSCHLRINKVTRALNERTT